MTSHCHILSSLYSAETATTSHRYGWNEDCSKEIMLPETFFTFTRKYGSVGYLWSAILIN